MRRSSSSRSRGKGGSTKKTAEPESQSVDWYDLDLSDESNFRTAAINAFNLTLKPCEKKSHRLNCKSNPFCLKGFTSQTSILEDRMIEEETNAIMEQVKRESLARDDDDDDDDYDRRDAVNEKEEGENWSEDEEIKLAIKLSLEESNQKQKSESGEPEIEQEPASSFNGIPNEKAPASDDTVKSEPLSPLNPQLGGEDILPSDVTIKSEEMPSPSSNTPPKSKGIVSSDVTIKSNEDLSGDNFANDFCLPSSNPMKREDIPSSNVALKRSLANNDSENGSDEDAETRRKKRSKGNSFIFTINEGNNYDPESSDDSIWVTDTDKLAINSEACASAHDDKITDEILESRVSVLNEDCPDGQNADDDDSIWFSNTTNLILTSGAQVPTSNDKTEKLEEQESEEPMNISENSENNEGFMENLEKPMNIPGNSEKGMDVEDKESEKLMEIDGGNEEKETKKCMEIEEDPGKLMEIEENHEKEKEGLMNNVDDDDNDDNDDTNSAKNQSEKSMDVEVKPEEQARKKCAEPDKDDGSGVNPLDLIKEDLSFPTGIRNLGATCYMNSLLQTLFAVKEFRAGLYKWTPNSPLVENDSVCQELQKLFVELQLTNKKYVNAENLLKSMNIDPMVQEDPQEFWNLFISLLKEVFEKSSVKSVAKLAEGLFFGTQLVEMECSVCKKRYPNESSFNYIGVSTERKSLEESLSACFEDEKLEGTNKYSCRHCRRKQDALRKTRIETLPPILAINILRYDFDRSVNWKKKIHTNFSFPMNLSMKKFVSGEVKKKSTEYELFSVLSHCGETANGGHYICFTKSGSKWFKCDDDNVTEMKEDKYAFCTDDERSNKKVTDKKGHYSSKNAYIMFYRRKDPAFRGKIVPPPEIAAPIEAANAKLKKEADVMRLEREKENEITEKTNEVKKSLIEDLLDKSSFKDPDNLYWVSSKWVKEFMRSNKPIKIDNSGILCSHGKGLSPYDLESLKCISDVSWVKLVSYCGGGPCVKGLKVCPECLESYCRWFKSNRTEKNVVEEIKKLLQQTPRSNGYFLSLDAIGSWKKDQTCLKGLDILSGVVCKHGNLDPTKKRRKCVVPEVWKYFAEATGTETSFRQSAPECEECLKEKAEKKTLLNSKECESRRVIRAFAEFFDNKDSYYLSQGTFYVIDAEWFEEWQFWLNKRSQLEYPRKLDNESLICREHGKLLVDLNTPDIDKSKVVFMKTAEWEKLNEHFVSPTCRKITVKRSHSRGDATVTPEICYECLVRNQETALTQKKFFEDSYIIVHKLPDIYDAEDDVRKAALESEENESTHAKSRAFTSENGKRHSRRIQKKSTFKVEGVSYSTQVNGLKYHIASNYGKEVEGHEALSIVLVYDKKVLRGEDTLEQCNVVEGSTLYLGILNDERYLALLASELEDNNVPYSEAGFAGSILVGGTNVNKDNGNDNNERDNSK